jgi:hypothetical protein
MKRRSDWPKRLVFLVVFGLAALTTCRPEGTELAFQTIAERHGVGASDGRSYLGEDPDLLIITVPEEIDTPGMDIQFGSELAEQLRAVDYTNSFVIIVLRGLLGARSPKYTVDILQVTRSGDRVVLQTHFGAPGPEEGGYPAFSSPYHAIAVSKEGAWKQDIRFVLEVDGQVMKERTHFIP